MEKVSFDLLEHIRCFTESEKKYVSYPILFDATKEELGEK